jgi:hypothetical protein
MWPTNGNPVGYWHIDLKLYIYIFQKDGRSIWEGYGKFLSIIGPFAEAI